jgi:dUTP pyrophosphatase
MIRGFQEVSKEFMVHEEVETKLPYKGSKASAGYDFYSKKEVVIYPDEKFRFFTDVKAYMLEDEVLEIYPRSSIGIKKNLVLTNTVGIIDADYYGNKDNDGNIIIEFKNIGLLPSKIEIGERIAQGIFKKKLDADDGAYSGGIDNRNGGVGSTGE